MIDENSYSEFGFAAFWVGVAVVAGGLYFSVIKPFCSKRRYIKMEMHRAQSEAGKRYWQHEMKKLYRSLLPWGNE